MKKTIVKNIGTLLTMNPKRGEGRLGIVKNTFLELETPGSSDEINAEGKLVTPGLVDCHTHAMYGGDRADEFFMRLQGESYELIAKKGGGIQKTVRQTAETLDEELLALTKTRLDQFYSQGVTIVEIKSGYGLSVE